MLSQEAIDDIHEFAEKLLKQREESEALKNQVVNKRGASKSDSSDDLPVSTPYTPPSSYVAKSSQ